MHGGKFALIGLSGNIRIGSFLVAAGHCSFNSLSLLGVHKVGEFPIGINVRRGPRLLMNVDDRMGSCRDKGRMWGRVGAWCLSWWQRDPLGTAWSKQVAPQPGQAPGPLIHSTPPLVPTGPWAASASMDRIPRFGRQHSLGAREVDA